MKTDPDTAAHLVQTIIHMNMKQDGTEAIVKFTSSHFKLSNQVLASVMSKLAILDKPSFSMTRGQPSAAAAAAASAS